MVPAIVAALLESGLGILGNAVLAKGKEVVEDKLGVKLPSGTEPLTPDQVVALKQAETSHEEWLIEAGIRKAEQELRGEESAAKAVTERWVADMQGDSKAAKNIRPAVLAYLTVAITLMAALPITVDDAWIALLQSAYMLVLGAYFVGRSYEKTRGVK